MIDPWDRFKHAYERWERRAGPRMESALRSPLLLAPASVALSALWRARALRHAAMGAGWAMLGLSTRAEHEELLDEVRRLESRLAARALVQPAARRA